MLTTRAVFAFCFVLESCKTNRIRLERFWVCLVLQETLLATESSTITFHSVHFHPTQFTLVFDFSRVWFQDYPGVGLQCSFLDRNCQQHSRCIMKGFRLSIAQQHVHRCDLMCTYYYPSMWQSIVLTQARPKMPCIYTSLCKKVKSCNWYGSVKISGHCWYVARAKNSPDSHTKSRRESGDTRILNWC